GLWPAIRTSRTSLIASLRDTQPRSGVDTRTLLLGGEVALSIILLVGAGLFVRTVQAGLRSDLGFDPAPLAAVRVNPALGGFKGLELSNYYRVATERAAQLPGVSGVAVATHVPLAGFGTLPFVAGDKAATSEASVDDQVNAGWVYISPNYFDVLRVPIVEGRAFTPGDTARALSTAIVNQAAARALFPDGHAVGRQMVHAGSMRFTIVGVVRDTKYASVQDRNVPSTRPAAALEQLRHALTAVPPHPPIREARLVADQVNLTLEPQRFGATLVGTYSLLALLIASVGVYGLVAYIVAKQQREIGIRIALGARPGQVIELVAVRIDLAVGAGVLVGLVAASLASRAMDSFLYGVTRTDIPAFAAAAAAMILAALAACVIPARRALTLDPVRAMRLE